MMRFHFCCFGLVLALLVAGCSSSSSPPGAATPEALGQEFATVFTTQFEGAKPDFTKFFSQATLEKLRAAKSELWPEESEEAVVREFANYLGQQNILVPDLEGRSLDHDGDMLVFKEGGKVIHQVKTVDEQGRRFECSEFVADFLKLAKPQKP